MAAGFGIGVIAAMAATYFALLRPARRRTDKLRARLRALYDRNADMVAYYDPTGRLMHANAAAAEWFGADSSKVGWSFEEHVAPAERPTSALHFTRALNGVTCKFETVFVRADGSALPVYATLQPMFAGDAVVGVYGIARDATRMRDVQSELVRTEQQLGSIFEYNSDAAIAVDRRGRFLRVNSAMERLSGYREPELVGEPVSKVIPSVLLEPAQKFTRRVFAGRAVEAESQIVRKDGSLCHVYVHAVPRMEDGIVTGAFAFLKDTSAQQAIKERLAENDGRMRSLYVVASSSEPDPNVQVEEALALGCQALFMQVGIVTHSSRNTVTVRNRFGAGTDLSVGFRLPLSQGVARRLIGTEKAVAIGDLTVEPWARDVARLNASWTSFIGTAVTVDGAAYGSLCFIGTDSRPRAFEQSDLDFIDLMSTVVGSALLRERRQAEMREMAFRDPLTGLANRTLFEEHVGRAIATARRTNQNVVLHFIDLDRFKPINDTYGHAA
ncbi:MAG TPA: PAS domain S-box protein, partial [Candidatus Baltobacteraceae bacterium]|nr:PAS domain S-box protein [Candidatus Baltobacteraceae bacterium]